MADSSASAASIRWKTGLQLKGGKIADSALDRLRERNQSARGFACRSIGNLQYLLRCAQTDKAAEGGWRLLCAAFVTPALLKVAAAPADIRQRSLRSTAFVALTSNPAGSNGPPLHCHIAAWSSWLGSAIASKNSE